MKRRRTDTLTGGTGDVNPQILRSIAVTSNTAATDTTITVQHIIPNPLFTLNQVANGNKATVMEITKIRFNVKPPQVAVDATARNSSTFIGLFQNDRSGYGNPTNTNDGYTQVVRARPLASYLIEVSTTGTLAVASFKILGTEDFHDKTFDMDDGNGHGILFTGQNLYFQIIGICAQQYNSTSGFGGYVEVFYRAKDVSLQEYLGMVATQNPQ